MEVINQQLDVYTSYLVEQYYALNPQPLFDILSEDCMWIGTGNLFIFGKQNIVDCFKDGFVMPAFDVTKQEFHMIYQDETHVVVIGQYHLHSRVPEQAINASWQRLTFCFHKQEDRYLLYHMHVSNEWSELVDDEIFPVKVSHDTYEYLISLMEKEEDERQRKILIKSEGTMQFIFPQRVIYIEAVNKSVVIHYVDRDITIKKQLKEIEKLVPDYFCRIHRSYLINCQYIEEVYSYRVILENGIKLPIPEKRYTQVKNDIEEKYKQHQTMFKRS